VRRSSHISDRAVSFLHHGRLIVGFVGGVGGAVAIALTELLAERTTFPLLFVPFATSIVLDFSSRAFRGPAIRGGDN
jgi:uncharacterized membrane protein YjjP (DUF1212 family)